MTCLVGYGTILKILSELPNNRLFIGILLYFFGLIMASAVIYTLGVAVHRSQRLRYQDALWHACVVIAAALHFAAILRDVVWPAVYAV